jgi:hypothetical protein
MLTDVCVELLFGAIKQKPRCSVSGGDTGPAVTAVRCSVSGCDTGPAVTAVRDCTDTNNLLSDIQLKSLKLSSSSLQSYKPQQARSFYCVSKQEKTNSTET